jgi:hypothetical protein
MDDIVMTGTDHLGRPEEIRFAGREAAWLRFLRWLRENGRLEEGTPDHDEQ